MILALALILAFFSFVTPANAGIVVGIISAVASSAIGGAIINAVIGIALSVGASLIRGLFKKDTGTKDPGTSISLRVGGSNPLIFPLGDSATGGIRIYTGIHDAGGKTPNEFAVDVLALSALPVSGLIGLWVNDQRVTIMTDEPKTEMGWPIQEYRKDGKDYAWIDFYDGTQTAPSPYLIDKFGAHPTYPWESDMIGDGVAYAIFTARYDRAGLWAGGFPSLLFELGSIPLYDVRKDSTAGGSGSHRWNDPSTWEPSNNAMVRAYNVARGIHYKGEWIYGGQNWPAFRLPVSSWMAGMNACDVMIDGEPQFHGGGIVECDVEPAKTIEELLRSSSGLIAEVGGIYKIRIGAPGAPVYAFTDDNVVVTREQGFSPFPGLEDTFNIVRISYTEPVEKWATKESPERRNDTFIVEDDNRELPMSVELPWVLSNTTAQRIGLTALNNGRRFRRHNHFLPPEAVILEPLDVVAWSSAHNGYINKSFDVEQITGTSSFLHGVVIREVDPSDYNYNPATDKLPYQTIPMVTIYPPAQPMTGWQVLPAILYDHEERPRRPSIEVRFEGGLTDIASVQVEVRKPGALVNEFFGIIPYPKNELNPSVILQGIFLPNEDYEVRGTLIPSTDRDTTPSSWLAVTTPDVKFLAGVDFNFDGVIGFEDLGSDLGNYQGWLGGSIREIERRLEELDTWIADQDFGNEFDRQQIRQELVASIGNVTAAYTREINVLAAEQLALASSIEQLDAQVFDPDTGLPAIAEAVVILEAEVHDSNSGLVALANAITALSASDSQGNVNEANWRMSIMTGPAGYSRIGGEARAGGTGAFRTAGFYVDVPNNPALPTRFLVDANQFIVTDGVSGTAQPFVVQGSTVYVENVRLGTLNFDRLLSNNGKLDIRGDGANAYISLSN